METFDIVLLKMRIDGVAVVDWLRADLPLIANALTLHEREGADTEILGYHHNVTPAQARMVFERYTQAAANNVRENK